MKTDDFLVTHAYKHVWCAPEQDRQHVLAPRRITPKVGARGSVTVIWKRFNLPTQGPRYHVFQFGNIAQSTLGVKLEANKWTAVSTQLELQSMLIDVYTDRGRMIPRSHAFFLLTDDGNIVIAVEALTDIGNFGEEDIYVRFYSNVFHDRADMHDPHEGIEYHYSQPINNSQISALTFTLRNMRDRGGYVFCYVNGWFVNDVTASTVARGDMVEMIRDSSVIRTEEFPVNDLPVFLSTMDNKQKYLIKPSVMENDLIHYRDDQDIFLLRKYTNFIQKGVFYHKNSEDAVRMVTHRDYSIPTHYVDRYTSLNKDWAEVNQLTALLVIRRSGMDKPLIPEAHHIHDLYKFEGDDWYASVMGSEAVVDVWRVEALEKSMYTALMRAPSGTITRKMVEDAYGYNYLAKIIADTPQLVGASSQWVELPFGLRGESTIYEYDANGILLSRHDNRNGQWYVPRSPSTRYIEGVVGRGGSVLSTVYGADANIPKDIDHRCYVCPIEHGLPNGVWVDVTDDPDYCEVVDRTVLWKVDHTRYLTAVKMDDTFIAYDLTLNYPDGLLRFSLNVKELRIDGMLYEGLVEIPVGQLDLWLNGHPIIEHLDWVMVGKEICIINKQYRKQDGTGDVISIRGTGFCNPDMSRAVDTEYGFVENGLLSRNNRWNLRDDRVVRVVADGRLWSKDELSWAEDRPEVILDNVRNGAPYQVVAPLIPLRGLTQTEAFYLKAKADETDRQVEDYMTIHMGEVPPQEVSIIDRRHTVYSPFVAKLMHDLKDGFFDQTPLADHYTDLEVRKWCEPYMWLLKYEPTRMDLDGRYVVIDAHESATPYELTIYHYNFLARAIRVILDGAIDITHAVTIFNQN